VSYLVDVNVWVALALADHPAHPAARDWFLTLSAGEAAFCTFTELAFLRLLTNPALTSGGVPFTVAEAWAARAALRRNARVTEVSEPGGLMVELERQTQRLRHLSGASWTDLYLSAFAARTGLRLATLDRALARRTKGVWIRAAAPNQR